MSLLGGGGNTEDNGDGTYFVDWTRYALLRKWTTGIRGYPFLSRFVRSWSIWASQNIFRQGIAELESGRKTSKAMRGSNRVRIQESR